MLARPIRRLAAATCALALLAAPAGAESASEEGAAATYARDNSIFTLYHEFGHVFVDQYDLPVLAREEDAVDNLATLMALDDYDTSEDGGVLGNAVYGWELIMAEDGTDAPDASTLYGSHSLNSQRAFTMLCLMVGRDKAVFGDAAASFGMDEERQDSCSADYQQAETSWNRVLDEHRVANGAEGFEITVTYGNVSQEHAFAKDILQKAEVLETFAARMEAEFAIPEGIILEAIECNEENAYYDEERLTVMLCYEMVSYYYRQYMDAPAAGEAASGKGEEDEEEEPYWEPTTNVVRRIDK